MENPYANLQMGNPGQAFLQTYEAARARRKEEATQNALMQYVAAESGGNGLVAGDNPMMDKALQDVIRNNPQMGMQLIRRRQTQQASQREQQIKIIGNAAAMADTPEKWDAIADQLEAQGFQGAAQYKGKFSPGLRAALMAQAGIGDKAEHRTAMQEDYEFLKGIDPKLADSFIQGRANPVQWIRTEDDSGIHLTPVPRTASGGTSPSQPPQAAIDYLKANPSLAAQFDEKYGTGSAARILQGGQTPQASGGFPSSGN